MLYAELPILPSVNEILLEDDCVKLLGQFYGCEAIINSQKIPLYFDEENEIDLYENWDDHMEYMRQSDGFKQFVKPGVKLAMIHIMLNQAIEAANEDQDLKSLDVIDKLLAIKNGESVPLSWGLKTFDRRPYVGSLIESDQPDLINFPSN